MSLQVVGIDNSLVDYAAELAFHRQLRVAGATYVAIARRLDIPLVTWDPEQLERAGAVLSVPAPMLRMNEQPGRLRQVATATATDAMLEPSDEGG